MTDSLRDRIAAVQAQHHHWDYAGALACACGLEFGRSENAGWEAAVQEWAQHVADAVIAALKDDGWTLAPPGVAVFTETYVGDGRGSYASNFCRGGCDCSCCYGYADEPCHCRDAICNCGGDREAHGQKPLPVEDDPCEDDEDDPYEAKADAARQEWADDEGIPR